MSSKRKYKSLSEFYPYYLSEHLHPVCRGLHFIGTLLLFIILFGAIFLSEYTYLWLLPVVGYGFAWVGHYFFEKNKPATFQYPLYSLASDFIMFKDLLIGKEKFNPEKQ